jgi:hypothetical protein
MRASIVAVFSLFSFFQKTIAGFLKITSHAEIS